VPPARLLSPPASPAMWRLLGAVFVLVFISTTTREGDADKRGQPPSVTGLVTDLPQRPGRRVNQKWEGRLYWNSGAGLGGFFGPWHTRVQAVLTFEVEHVDDPKEFRARFMKDTANIPETKRRELDEGIEAILSMGPVPTYRLTGRFRCTGT